MNKPLVIFDLETTGTDKSKDKIIQIAAIKVVDGEIVDSINEYVQPIGQYTISYGAYFKHKITPQFLSDKPTLRDLAPKIIEFFEGCDILTYNGNRFDIPFLKQELLRIGYDINFLEFKCYDAYLEEQRRNNTKLETTYKRYYGKTMDEDGLTAHDALSDVKATYRIFKAQQEIQPYEPEKMYDENGVLTGFVCVQLKKSFCYDEYMPEITEVYVRPAYRERGIASEMISFAEDYCSKNYPLHKYELLTGTENLIAQSLYNKLGYIDDSELHLSKRIKK